MFTLLIILAVIAIVLKVINTKARFDAADRAREMQEAAEENAEIEEIRAEAVDVDVEDE